MGGQLTTPEPVSWSHLRRPDSLASRCIAVYFYHMAYEVFVPKKELNLSLTRSLEPVTSLQEKQRNMLTPLKMLAVVSPLESA